MITAPLAPQGHEKQPAEALYIMLTIMWRIRSAQQDSAPSLSELKLSTHSSVAAEQHSPLQ